MQVSCRCCSKPIDIELQIRVNLRTGEQRDPIFLITCRNPRCAKLYTVTLAVLAIADYAERDLTIWGLDAAS
jgi:hypothetical protein